jgi:adenosylhomocysteinase
MKDGAIICNTGHYDCEINIEDLEARAKGKRQIRPSNEEYTLKDGRRIYLLAQGRLINLAAAEGHPSEVMDMSFANQYLALCRLAETAGKLENTVYELPVELDQQLAQLKLETMGMEIDKLTDEQIEYLTDYAAGT